MSIPILYDEQERIKNILEDKPGIFDIDDDSNINSNYAVSYRLENIGIDVVKKYETIIEQESQAQGVDPNLVKAIIFTEVSQGWYGYLTESINQSDTIFPMNISVNTWATGLDYKAEDFTDPILNIRAGITLIHRIEERLLEEDKTISKIASIYNFIGQDKITNYGARVEEVYNQQSWTCESYVNPVTGFIQKLMDTTQSTSEFCLSVAIQFGTTIDEVKSILSDYLKDYLSNLPVGEAISAILSAQLDFLNAQGLSTRWALHDPLVMDLDGDGIELTNIEDSNAYFDIDGDGIAERTGWVKGDDGLLVRDINGNGNIDDFMIKIAC